MKRIAVGAMALVLFPLLRATSADEPMYFEGPAKVDTGRAAAPLLKRFKEYGYAGVTVTVVTMNDRKLLRVDAEPGITKEMRKVVLWLTSVAGQKIEIRPQLEFAVPESEQFPTPSDDLVGSAKAPKGGKWYRRVQLPETVPDKSEKPASGGGSASGKILTTIPVCLLEASPVKMKEMTELREGKGEVCYQLCDDAAAKLRQALSSRPPKSHEVPCCIVVDGLALGSAGSKFVLEEDHNKIVSVPVGGMRDPDRRENRTVKVKGKAVRFVPAYAESRWNCLRLVLKIPLPFALQEVGQDNKPK